MVKKKRVPISGLRDSCRLGLRNRLNVKLLGKLLLMVHLYFTTTTEKSNSLK
jgi:hypothetical protein